MAEQQDSSTENADATPVAEAQETTDVATPETAGDSQEGLAPRERRARSRAVKAAQARQRGPRTEQERHDDRQATRAAKASERRAGRARAAAKAKAQPRETVEIAAREHVAGAQKMRQGVVVSDKADKTITVRIDMARRHRRYDKIVRTSRTLHAHDESNDAHIGDTVTVRESRPLSRTKRWRLISVLERAK